MALEQYRAKRNFSATPEPNPRVPRRQAERTIESGGAFVVQKHDARRLHYDFRLELDGVLKSWAVTRGPSLVAGDKRLAVAVEDHPLEYGSFEGAIPKGEYGGGAVLIWDRGSWAPIGDPRSGLTKGRLEFELRGQKLKGRWRLVRMRAKPRDKHENWLLIKSSDEYARAKDGPDILEDRPESAATGRPIEDVALEEPGWSKDGPIRNRAAAHPPRVGVSRVAPQFEGDDEGRPDDRVSDQPEQRAVDLTHPDRLYWPDEGVTKQGLADYYAQVWSRMAPFVVERPLALLRSPDGISGQKFFQKHPWKGMNERITVARDPKDPGEPLIAIRDFGGLIGLIQSGALEVHPWGSTLADWERPDMIVMDLDPGEDVAWEVVIEAAREVRTRLNDLGLAAFIKTSGGKGLHIVSPVKPKASWPAAKTFTKSIADAMTADQPDRYVSTIAKAKRTGKILVDYLRNQRGATAIAPYSTRARPGAAVSMPIEWEELEPGLGPAAFTVMNAPARLRSLSRDPWAGFGEAAAPIEARKGRRRAA